MKITDLSDEGRRLLRGICFKLELTAGMTRIGFGITAQKRRGSFNDALKNIYLHLDGQATIAQIIELATETHFAYNQLLVNLVKGNKEARQRAKVMYIDFCVQAFACDRAALERQVDQELLQA